MANSMIPMATAMANRMAIAMTRCHVRDMAHSTPLQTTTGIQVSCGVSITKSKIVKAVEGHRPASFGFGFGEI